MFRALKHSPHLVRDLVLVIVARMLVWSGLYVALGKPSWSRWFISLVSCGTLLLLVDLLFECVLKWEFKSTFLLMKITGDYPKLTPANSVDKAVLQACVYTVLKDSARLLAIQVANEELDQPSESTLRWAKEDVKRAKRRFWRAHWLARIYGFEVKKSWKEYVQAPAAA